MSRLKHLTLLFCGLTCFAGSPGYAQDISNTTITATQTGIVDVTNTTAKDWNLTETEWEQYQRLMNREAGLYYRHLSPSFVLGIYAKNDAERDKYAARLYKEEKQRLDKLFAFNRAYMTYATEQDGGKPRIDPELVIQRKSELNIPQRPQSSSVSLKAGRDRYVVFVKRNCSVCDTAVKRLVDARRRFEIYYSGAETEEEIRRWASSLKIPRESVTNGDISLNFDTGYSQGLGIRHYPKIERSTELKEEITVDEAVRSNQ